MLLDSLMVYSFDRGLFNGAVVVSQEEKIIYQKSLGYSGGEKEEGLVLSDLFSTGSMAKSFHVTAILLLHEQGKLKLEDRLSKYMPELSSWADQLTINHLLNYASGLPQLRYREVKGEEDVLRHLLELDSLTAPPGSTYLYNQNTPIIYKTIVERVSKSSFKDFVREEILHRVGIRDSRFDVPIDDSDRALSFNHKGENDEPYTPFTGWLDMTALDANIWISALVKGKVVSNSTFEKFISNQYFDNTGTSLGKGVFKNDSLIRYEIRGAYYNYRSESQYNPQSDVVITLLDNSGGRYVGRLAAAIDSITQDKRFEIPKKSIYWTMRDSVGLDADGLLNYYDLLQEASLNTYNFEDPDALYYIARRFYRDGDNSGAKKIIDRNLQSFPLHSDSKELERQIFSSE